MELWDAYRADGTPTGGTLVRGEPIPEGLYHLVCEVLVRHSDGSYLCMKRSEDKPNFPGFYEATAGGSALQGEDMYRCVHRELLEETGITSNHFQHLYGQVFEDDQCIFHTFLCTVDCPKDSVRLQSGETEGYRWMPEREFIRFINSPAMIPSQKRRYLPWFREMGYLSGPQVCYGTEADIDSWMALVIRVRENFPGLDDPEEHRKTVLRFMGDRRALCVKGADGMDGILLFSRKRNMICFLAVAPEARRKGIATALLGEAVLNLNWKKPITVTTFRSEDRKGTAPRQLYQKYGFLPGVLLEEYGYPLQEFTLTTWKG